MLWVSPSAEAVLGWPVESLLGRRIAELVHPDDLERVRREQSELMLNDRAIGGLEARLATADGGWLWMGGRGRVLTDENGLRVGGIDALRDISSQVEMREELAASRQLFELLAENASDVVALIDSDGRTAWVSGSLPRMMGWQARDWLGSSLRELAHPDDVGKIDQAVDLLRVDAQAQAEAVVRFRHRDGSYHHWAVMGRIIPTALNDRSLVASFRDVDDAVRAALALEHSEARLKATIDSLLDPHALLEAVRDSSGAIIDFVYADANDAACHSVGLPREQLIGSMLLGSVPTPPSQGSPGHGSSGLFDAYRQVVSSGEPLILDAYRCPGASADVERRFDVRGVRLGDAISCTWRDVTDRHLATRALARSEQRFRLAMESAPIGMAVLGLDGGFTEVNPALCRMLNRGTEWLLRHKITDVLYPGEESADRRIRDEALARPSVPQIADHRLVTAAGDPVWVEHSVGLLRDEDGQPTSYVSQFSNITEQRQAREQLRFQASHDSLTELANRGALMTAMKSFLGRAAHDSGDPLAVLFCDIDGLKAINDNFGHAAGDDVILETAKRLRAQVGDAGLVARLGGDEFIIALPGVPDASAAGRMAGKVTDAMHPPIAAHGRTLNVTVSIGISMAEPGDDADAILTRADRALYRAKDAGRDRVIADHPGGT